MKDKTTAFAEDLAVKVTMQALKEDRDQAYTSLVEGIAELKKVFEGCELADHDRTYLAALTDILENVVNPLYGKK